MNEKQKQYMIMGLAMGLPSTIIGVAALSAKLVDAGYISEEAGLAFVIIMVAYMFFLMVRYALKKKNKD